MVILKGPGVKTSTIRHIACVADSNQRAQAAFKELASRYDIVSPQARTPKPDVFVVLGGDGFMLQTLHKYMKRRIPFYGMNCGSVGFLLNDFSSDRLMERLQQSRAA